MADAPTERPNNEARAAAPAGRERLLSLDVFRGADIALMILVNMTWDREAVPWQFFHVGWNEGKQGVTLTDLVFPWFLFIVGVALPFSMTRGRGATLAPHRKLLTALRRALVIYTLGLLLDAASSGAFRVFKWNILQIIGVAYFLAVCAWLAPRWLQASLVTLILAAKWYVLSVMPHPDHGRSVWFFQNAEGEVSATRYGEGITQVSGEQVLKDRLTGLEPVMPWSASIDWGPFLDWLTNLANLLPATAVVIMGSWIGLVLLRDATRGARAAGLLAALGALAWLLSWLWNLHHPWSKDFFTASYALLAAGTGTLALAILYWLIDVKQAPRRRLAVGALLAGSGGVAFLLAGPSRWTFLSATDPILADLVAGLGVLAFVVGMIASAKALARRAAGHAAAVLRTFGAGAILLFRVPGVNAIALYFGNEFVFKAIATQWSLPALDPSRPVINAWYESLRETLGASLGSWAFALSWLGVWWLSCFWLYRRRIFIKV